jgi:Histidine kinase/Y_Y_Y domain/Two component regulator propeller
MNIKIVTKTRQAKGRIFFSKKSIILLFLIFFLRFLAFTQSSLNLAFHHLNHEGGLSNNNVFYMHHDTRGFVWFGTLNGLTRFDGINCKVYKPSNSKIKGIAIKNIVEDKDGNLWVGSDEGLNFYNRKTDTFSFINFAKNIIAHPFVVDHKGKLWVNFFGEKHQGLYVYDPEIRKLTLVTNKTASNFNLSPSQNLKEVKHFYCGGPNDIGFYKLSFENYKEKSSEVFFDGKNNLPALNHIGDYVSVENDSTLWITGNNVLGLIKFNPFTKKYLNYSEKINYFSHVVFYRNYLIMGSNEGLAIFDKTQNKFVQRLQATNSNPTGVGSNWAELLMIDKEENLFLSNLGPGIDFTNLNREISDNWLDADKSVKLGYNDNNIHFVVKNENQIYAKYQNGPLLVLDENGNYLRKYDNMVALISDSQKKTWLYDRINFISEGSAGLKSRIKYRFPIFGGNDGWQVAMTEIDKNKFVVSGVNGLFEMDIDKNTMTAFDEFNKVKQYKLGPLHYDPSSQNLFVAGNWWTSFNVLKKVNGEWKTIKKLPGINVYAIKKSILADHIWLCCRSGLIKLNTKNFAIKKYTEANGLPDNFVSDIIEEPNGNYWIVTGKGIAYYDQKKKRYRIFTSKDGAYSSEYDWNSAFLLADGRAVFGGTNGITVMEKTAAKNYNVRPKIQITQLIVNEKPQQLTNYIGEAKTIELAADQNSFGLDLVGIEYGFPQKVKLQYKLEGYDKQWVNVGNPATARYTNVEEGSYQFLVKATDENGTVSSDIKTLNIKVHAPFYRTTWFRGLLLVGLASLSYLLYKLRIKQIRSDTRKKEELKRIKAESEISALRSQMNPHFIFNCLNTVDSYILLNKTDEASEFLNKFSKLIRIILENSRQEFVPLQQDIKALELYIKLEQERSNPKFKFEVNIIDELLKNEYFIPSMLVQPFVENAILHGLRHKTEVVGNLKINYETNNNQLIIKIIDNGIGRQASRKINFAKSFSKNSVGIELTEQRILKLNESYPERAFFKITDINEPNNTGTIIEIDLPLLTQNDIKS